MLRYLAYGSNLLPARLEQRLGHIDILGTTALPDWRLRFHKRGADGSGKCNIVAAAGATAYGVVYAITAAQQATLDTIEGVGKGYAGATIATPAFGDCYVYLALGHAIDDGLRPFDWYHAFVVAGARHHAMPPVYLEELVACTTLPDPDAARRAQNFALLDAASGV